MYDKILQLTEKKVVELLSKQLPHNNYYHNVQHTVHVVAMVNELAVNSNCTEEETFLVNLAAWFHDTGYIEKIDGHEEESVKIALGFLKDKGLNEAQQSTIERLIMATKVGVQPQNLLEKIMKDADCGHVALENYVEISEALRQELNAKNDEKISKLNWLKRNQEFFERHQFFTSFAQENWQLEKEKNKQKLQEEINRLDEIKTQKDKKLKLGRGVETLFRVQLKNHIDLSSIADTKANILLSVNAIIISVALTSLVPKLDSPSNLFLVIPTLVLTVFSVTSIVLSVISTRPKISNIAVTQEMIKNKQTNILFFGNFHKMTLSEFEWGIDYLMHNDDVLYNSLTRDLYYLGLVLERKYRLLRITYNVFMFGIIVSALAFIISYSITVKPNIF